MKQTAVRATPAPPSGATPPSKLKPIVAGILVAIVMGVGLYGFGFWKGSAQATAQKAQLDARVQAIQNQLRQSEAEVIAGRNRAQLMQARAELYRTALDLEKRNFGIANNHLKGSAELLGEVKESPGIDMAQLGTLREAIAKTDVNVATDLEAQRKMVFDFAAQLEALIPQDTASASDVQ